MKKVDENRPTTKKDLDELQINIVKALDKRISPIENHLSAIDKKFDSYATKENLDELESHIIIAVGKAIEEAKTELKSELGTKIDTLSYDTSGLRNRVIDLEIKHGSPHSHTA